MTSRRNRFALLVVAGLATAFVHDAFAAADCANPRKAGGEMTEGAFHGIEAGMQAITANKYNEAIDKLQKVADSGNTYEKAVAFYNMGFAYNAKNDLSGAAVAFQKSLDQNALPQVQQEQLQYNLGQIYVANGKYDEGIRTLEAYMADACAPILAEAHIFLANAYSEKKNFRAALTQLDQALAKSKGPPKETWVQLKLALNYELKDYRACAQTLVQLIGMAPAKPDYWRQLSSVFFEMKSNTESLAVLALAERQGFVEKPGEIKNLAAIYMLMELPYKAGNLLESAVEQGKLPSDEKTLEQISNAWINAREMDKAEGTLKKLAATTDKAEYWYRLGATYGDNERWKESREMLTKAINKSGFSHTGDSWFRIGVAAYSMKENKEASSAFVKAQGYDESRRNAAEWLRRIQNEEAMAAAAAAAEAARKAKPAAAAPETPAAPESPAAPEAAAPPAGA